MIIFDLDGTLADCSHRRHFVDPSKNKDYQLVNDYEAKDCGCKSEFCLPQKWVHRSDSKKFKPDWEAFYEACNKDVPIWPMVRVIESLGLNEVTLKDKEIQIWSGRCESVRGMTEHWLKYIIGNSTYSHLKMRPIGNTEPDEVLKEMWYYDATILEGKTIDFVFDCNSKSIEMWRRRGIFVFNCCQHDEEF